MASSAVKKPLVSVVPGSMITLDRIENNKRVVIRRNRDSKLICDLCNKDWCGHIELVVSQDLDVALMKADNSEWVGQTIMVPIVPTNDIWAECRYGSYNEKVEAVLVHLVDEIDRRTATRTGDLLELQFLGYLHKEEGRRILRSMVIDWFEVNVPDLLRCNSSAHGMKEESVLKINMRDQALNIAERWCAWANGLCLRCHKGMSNFDDLVPDK